MSVFFHSLADVKLFWVFSVYCYIRSALPFNEFRPKPVMSALRAAWVATIMLSLRFSLAEISDMNISGRLVRKVIEAAEGRNMFLDSGEVVCVFSDSLHTPTSYWRSFKQSLYFYMYRREIGEMICCSDKRWASAEVFALSLCQNEELCSGWWIVKLIG